MTDYFTTFFQTGCALALVVGFIIITFPISVPILIGCAAYEKYRDGKKTSG